MDYIGGRAEGERAFQTSSSPRRADLLALVAFVGLCLLVALADGAVTATSVRSWYLTLNRPPGTPPNWMFGPVWTVLYVLMGVAAWLVWRRVDIGVARKRGAMRLWGWQLLLNALWTPAFFGLHSPALAFAVMAMLLGAVALTVKVFVRLERRAGLLLLPYAAWLCYAAYLNAGFWWLNEG